MPKVKKPKVKKKAPDSYLRNDSFGMGRRISREEFLKKLQEIKDKKK